MESLSSGIPARPDPASLPEDIYRILSDAVDHEVSEDNVEKAGELFKQVLRTRLRKKTPSSGEQVLRFSSLGKKDRQLWYAANKPETAEETPPKALLKFLYGDLIEVLIIFLAKEAGHEVTDEQLEVNEDGVVGHIDCLIDGIPVDVKSASPYGFKKFENGTFVFDDPFGYVQQLSGYANNLGKTDRAGFLAVEKVDGSICFAEIDEYTIRGNEPKPRIDDLRSVINRPEPPVRCYPDKPDGKSGNRKLDIGCSYCPYKYECWKDSNNGQGLRKFFYSRGPVWLTHVEKTPKVDEA